MIQQKLFLLIKTLLLTASASSILMKKDKSLNLKQKDTKLKPWRTLQVIIAIIELLMV